MRVLVAGGMTGTGTSNSREEGTTDNTVWFKLRVTPTRPRPSPGSSEMLITRWRSVAERVCAFELVGAQWLGQWTEQDKLRAVAIALSVCATDYTCIGWKRHH